MSHRLLLTLICGFDMLMGAVALSPLVAAEAPATESKAPAAEAKAPVPEAKTPTAEAKAPAADPTYILAYKFKKNDAVRYETVHKVRFVSQFNGNVETATNATETQKVYRVVNVNPDGSAELELVIEWVRMKVDYGDDAVPIEFDSKAPGANTQAKFANVMKSVGKPQAHVKCAPSGKVIKIKDLTIVTPVAQGAQAIQLKDVALRDDFDFLTVFPTDPIKVGKTWVEKSEIQVTGEDKKLKEKVQLQRKYTLESVTGDQAKIAFETAVLTPVKSTNVAIQLIQRETKGKMVFDMTLGAVVTRTVNTDKSVINPVGNNTAMHSSSTLLERIMSQTADISDVPTNSAKQ